MEANALYDAYREQYYEGGTSSVYLWALEGGGPGSFAGCFLIKKGVQGHKFVTAGSWDSIHVIEVGARSKPRAGKKATGGPVHGGRQY